MASSDFDKEKNAFREYYTKNQVLFNRAGSHLENLIASLTSGSLELEPPTASHRIKDREECIKKFARKYQTNLETEQKEYEIKDYLTDLIGLRVVCYYETDITRVVEILRENFEVLEETDKSAELEAQENVFGYKGHHLDLKINDDRAALPEYRDYVDLRFEVQVRSMIQDAWSVLDHKIKYKQSIPHELKRQINALAALFEIADREFTNIRELTDKIRQNTKAVVQAGSERDAEPLDVFEFLAMTQPLFPEFQFQGYKADGFVQEINRWDREFGSKRYKEVLESYLETVHKYADFQDNENGNVLNPYTRLRHTLYLSDKEKFRKVLYDIQRSNFEKWLAQQGEENA